LTPAVFKWIFEFRAFLFPQFQQRQFLKLGQPVAVVLSVPFVLHTVQVIFQKTTSKTFEVHRSPNVLRIGLWERNSFDIIEGRDDGLVEWDTGELDFGE